MRSTLTIVLVALLASAGAAQTGTAPPAPQEPKTGRNDFDEKRPSSAGGLGGVKAKTNTRKLYVGGFPRTKLPGPRAKGPTPQPDRPVPPRQGPMRSERRPAVASPDVLGVKPKAELINRGKYNGDGPTVEQDRSPLQVLQEPRRFEPARVLNCNPDPRGCPSWRARVSDGQRIVRTSDGMFRSDERSRLLPESMRPRAAAPVEVEPEAAPGELGNTKLVGSRPEAAISQLQLYLTAYPDDFHAVRMLALALLANRNATEAASAMGRAYAADPLLARDAIVLEDLGLDGPKVSAMIQSAQASASKVGSNAWLMVLVLQQGQGQTTPAQAALEKAKRSGMPPELADLFAASLAVRAAEKPQK